MHDGPVLRRQAGTNLGFNDLDERNNRRIEIELPGGANVRIPSKATPTEQRRLIATIVQATLVTSFVDGCGTWTGARQSAGASPVGC